MARHPGTPPEPKGRNTIGRDANDRDTNDRDTGDRDTGDRGTNARGSGPGTRSNAGRRTARSAQRPAGPAPTRAALHEAALTHLARFSASEAGLVRVLDRRIDRWARRAAAETQAAATPNAATQERDPPDTAAPRAAAREVARALVQSGIVDDAAYAASRARSLTRAGRSRHAISAHLAQKGVQHEVAQAVLPEPDAELAAALAYARRRRLGPFRRDPPEGADLAALRRKEAGAMARAGFPQPVAMQALRMDRDAAEQAVIGLKQS